MRPQDKNSRMKSTSSPPSKMITIHEFIESGDLRGIKRLLRQKPFLLNKRSVPTLETPLHMCANHNRVKIMEYLVDWDGNVELELEAKNSLCETPLHVASKNGYDEAARLLLRSGANVEARNNEHMTPLHLAVRYAARSGNNSTVKALLEHYANRSAEDEEGMMPIDYLPRDSDDSELVKLLNEDDEESADEDDGQYYYDEEDDRQSNRDGTEDEEHDERESNSDDGDDEDVYEDRTSKDDGQYNFDEEDERQSNRDDQDESDSNSDATDDCHEDDDGARNENDIERKLDEFEKELAKIVGLHDLKTQLHKWAKGMILDEKRRATGIDLGPRKRPHMAFLGNPGTGKTTIARILGKLLRSVGVLSEKTVTEVQRTDLIGEYIGQTGPKTRAKIEEAMGGILFVDEAYRLAPQAKTVSGCSDYGVEALEEIMSVLEDGDIVVIFAGYTEPMKRVFASNPGFVRRVTHFFQFDDFSCEDLTQMLMLKMSRQDRRSHLYGFKLHESCNYESVLRVIEDGSSKELRSKMNGGLVDHVLNNARENLDSRLSMDSRGDELFTITLVDLEAGLRSLAERTNVA